MDVRMESARKENLNTKVPKNWHSHDSLTE